MKPGLPLWFLGICISWQLTANHISTPTNDPVLYEYDRETIKERVLSMESIVPPKYTTSVEGYLKGYLQRNRPKSERILGRILKYFPLFEKYLKEHNMPNDLKYLSVVESALVPTAVSRVGATGLWQFMPATGEQYDLKITRYVDDRMDPHKSTDAAMIHLQKQYKRFGKWELALAAYNSGGGRVNRAIRHSRSKNFWRLQRYLPRETRNYVPAFIAAMYMINNYKAHDLNPAFPELDLQLTEAIKVYKYLSFKKIEQLTGLSRGTIKELNPSYKRGFLPNNRNGNNLILPRRVILAVKDYLKVRELENQSVEETIANDLENRELYFGYKNSYAEAIYIADKNDSLLNLAELFNCSPYHLKAWNNLNSQVLVPGQEIKIWYPKKVVRFSPLSNPQIESLPAVPIKSIKKAHQQVALKKESSTKPKPIAIKESYLFYRLKRYESIMDVVRKFPGTTFQEVMSLNGFSKNNMPVAGVRIKIRRQ